MGGIKVSTIGKALAFSRSTGHPVVFIGQGWCGQLMRTNWQGYYWEVILDDVFHKV